MRTILGLRLNFREVKIEGRSHFLPVVICEAQRKRVHLDLLSQKAEKHLGAGVRIEVEHRSYRRPSQVREGESDRIEAYHLNVNQGEFRSRKGESLGQCAVLYRVVGQSSWMTGASVGANWYPRKRELPYRTARRRIVRQRRILPVEWI